MTPGTASATSPEQYRDTGIRNLFRNRPNTRTTMPQAAEDETVNRRTPIGSIWDLDPAADGAFWPHEDYEQVFLSAFQHAFGRPASPRRVSGYVQRYFRYGVVPAWVRSYVRDELQGVAVGNLAHAPLDPQFDLSPVLERIGTLLGLTPPLPPRRAGCRDYWLIA